MQVTFSSLFLEALGRVKERISRGEDRGLAFVLEMRGLGCLERVSNLYRIKDKGTGRYVFFRPNKTQARFLGERSGRDIILKSRQMGMTTLACIYAYDRALFDHWSTGIMSHLREKTGLIFEIVKNANEFFKKDWGHFYLPEEERDNTNRISWRDSKANITVSYDFRSLTVNFLHVSEAAFIETSRLTNSLQSVPESGEVVLESTSAGCGGFFYNQWKLWKAGGELAPFRGHFYPWFDHYPENPELWKDRVIVLNQKERDLQDQYNLKPYHLAWRRWKIDESCDSDEEVFEVEYPSDDVSAFMAGQNQVFSSSTLKYQESFVKEASFVGSLRSENKRVSFYKDSKGIVEIWDLPKSEDEYVIGADASEGIGKDASVAIVMSRKTGEQVAQVRGALQPDVFADELWKLGNFYNGAWINPEANGFGHTVIYELTRKGYSKIYRRHTIDEMTNKPTTKLGFLTTNITKLPMTDKFVQATREGKFRVRSKVLLEEMSTFIQIASKTGRSTRREARSECHDDCVMAACLAWEMHTSKGEVPQYEHSLPQEFRGAHVDEDTGFFIPNFSEEEYGLYD